MVIYVALFKRIQSFSIIFICLAMITGLLQSCSGLLMKYMVYSLDALQLDNIASVIFWPTVLFVGLNFPEFKCYHISLDKICN